MGLHVPVVNYNAFPSPKFPNPQRKRNAVNFDLCSVGHKEDEPYVRMLNKQAAEPLHTMLDDG
jgi:hypothetical protein